MAENGLVASSEYRGLTMVVTPAEALRRVQQLQAFVAKVMVKDTDYGIIPGTGNKPTLFQPGAQKLAEIYGFAQEFEDAGSTLDWDAGFFSFRKRCILRTRVDGSYVGDGVGSCNSREDRYAYRWLFASDLPRGLDPKTLKHRTFSGRNGRFTKYRMPNDDIYSLVNTLEKMACKRALVHAVISATRSSGIFTQDVEDLPPEAFGERIEAEIVEDAEASKQGSATEVSASSITPPAKTSLEDKAAHFWLHLVDVHNGDEAAALATLQKSAEFQPRDGSGTKTAQDWHALAKSEKWLHGTIRKYNEAASELAHYPGIQEKEAAK